MKAKLDVEQLVFELHIALADTRHHRKAAKRPCLYLRTFHCEISHTAIAHSIDAGLLVVHHRRTVYVNQIIRKETFQCRVVQAGWGCIVCIFGGLDLDFGYRITRGGMRESRHDLDKAIQQDGNSVARYCLLQYYFSRTIKLNRQRSCPQTKNCIAARSERTWISAAIQENVLPGHVAGVRTAQESTKSAELSWCTEALCRI